MKRTSDRIMTVKLVFAGGKIVSAYSPQVGCAGGRTSSSGKNGESCKGNT